MKITYFTTALLILYIAFFFVSCKEQPQKSQQKAPDVIELMHFPLDSLEGLITQFDVAIDKTHTSDGAGSVRITAQEPVTVRLFEVDIVNIDKARLFYEAKIKTENVQGKVYLEMLCHFPGKGEFFSRALNSSLSGTTNWTTQETPFILQAGEKPDKVKLNLVIEGTGTVWIDNIRLKKSDL